jgi:hypothetical protein
LHIHSDVNRCCHARFFSSFAQSLTDGPSVQKRQPPPPYPSDSHSRLDGLRGNFGLVADVDDAPSRLIIDVDRPIASRPMSSSSSSTFQASSTTMNIADDDDDSTNVPLNLTKRSTIDFGGTVAMDTRSAGNSSRTSPCTISSAQQYYSQQSASAASASVWKLEFGNQSPSLSSTSASSSSSSWLDRSMTGPGFRAAGGSVQRAAAVELRRPDSSPCLRREQRKCLSGKTTVDIQFYPPADQPLCVRLMYD